MRKMILLLGLLPVLSLSSCTDDARAMRVLQASGYTKIHLTGYAWTGCSKGDVSSNGFTAKGPTGISIEGVVCCGGWIGKACTVRLDVE